MAGPLANCDSRPMSETVHAVTVLAVDDHPRFLEAAQAVVEATPGFAWLGGVSSGAEALAAADREEPDLMLVDVNMPEMNGFELARELDDSHPRTLVALISAQDPDELPHDRGGAERTVVRKEILGSAWLRALWRRHRGEDPPAK